MRVSDEEKEFRNKLVIEDEDNEEDEVEGEEEEMQEEDEWHWVLQTAYLLLLLWCRFFD